MPASSASDDIVGSVGYVTTRIGGGARAGEVSVGLRGGSEAFIAYSSDAIERGATVVILGQRPGRVVDVTAVDT